MRITKSFGKNLISYEYESVVQNIRFIIFLLSLSIAYIYNGHLYEEKVRNITKEIKEIKEVEYEHTYLQELWLEKIKESALEKRLEKTGLQIAKVPPYKIP